MKKIIHKKLVRDLIPEIVKSSHENYTFYTAEPEEYICLLRSKLLEEVEEFLSCPALEELADILEVVESLCTALGFSKEQLQQTKNDKYKSRGGFHNKIVLLKR